MQLKVGARWQASEGYVESTPSKHSLFSDRQKAFFKVLRFAAHWAFGRVELNLAMPTLSDTTPRGTRGGVARTGLLSAVPLCGTGAIMVRVYRQPDERLSTQRPQRLTRTFNYTHSADYPSVVSLFPFCSLS